MKRTGFLLAVGAAVCNMLHAQSTPKFIYLSGDFDTKKPIEALHKRYDGSKRPSEIPLAPGESAVTIQGIPIHFKDDEVGLTKLKCQIALIKWLKSQKLSDGKYFAVADMPLTLRASMLELIAQNTKNAYPGIVAARGASLKVMAVVRHEFLLTHGTDAFWVRSHTDYPGNLARYRAASNEALTAEEMNREALVPARHRSLLPSIKTVVDFPGGDDIALARWTNLGVFALNQAIESLVAERLHELSLLVEDFRSRSNPGAFPDYSEMDGRVIGEASRGPLDPLELCATHPDVFPTRESANRFGYRSKVTARKTNVSLVMIFKDTDSGAGSITTTEFEINLGR